MKEYDESAIIREILWFLHRGSNPLEGWESIPIHELILQLRLQLDKICGEGALNWIMCNYDILELEGLE